MRQISPTNNWHVWSRPSLWSLISSSLAWPSGPYLHNDKTTKKHIQKRILSFYKSRSAPIRSKKRWSNNRIVNGNDIFVSLIIRARRVVFFQFVHSFSNIFSFTLWSCWRWGSRNVQIIICEQPLDFVKHKMKILTGGNFCKNPDPGLISFGWVGRPGVGCCGGEGEKEREPNFDQLSDSDGRSSCTLIYMSSQTEI